MRCDRLWRCVLVVAVCAGSVSAPVCGQSAESTLLEVPHSFARYATPTECLADVTWVEGQFWRERRPDTVYAARAGRPNQPVTVEQVRRCVSRFSVSTAAPADLLALGRAFLAIGAPASADSAFARLAALTARPAKPWTLFQIVSAYLDAAEPRLDPATTYVGMLDALGASAAGERTLAHVAFADRAHARDSVALQARETMAALAASRALVGDAQRDYVGASARAYLALAQLRARQGDALGARAALDTGHHALAAVMRGAESLLDRQAWAFQLLGAPAPPIQATMWANTGAEGERRPVAGRPSLVVFWGVGSVSGISVLRRLSDRFASRGLDVTIVHRTGGYYLDQLVTADTEMVRWRHLFLTELRLPVAVAVWATPLGRRDDGRVTVLAAPNEEAYQCWSDAPLMAYVIDARGIVRLTTPVAPEHEAMLEDVLETLVSH